MESHVDKRHRIMIQISNFCSSCLTSIYLNHCIVLCEVHVVMWCHTDQNSWYIPHPPHPQWSFTSTYKYFALIKACRAPIKLDRLCTKLICCPRKKGGGAALRFNWPKVFIKKKKESCYIVTCLQCINYQSKYVKTKCNSFPFIVTKTRNAQNMFEQWITIKSTITNYSFKMICITILFFF